MNEVPGFIKAELALMAVEEETGVPLEDRFHPSPETLTYQRDLDGIVLPTDLWMEAGDWHPAEYPACPSCSRTMAQFQFRAGETDLEQPVLMNWRCPHCGATQAAAVMLRRHTTPYHGQVYAETLLSPGDTVLVPDSTRDSWLEEDKKEFNRTVVHTVTMMVMSALFFLAVSLIVQTMIR